MGSDRNIDKYILILALCSSLIALLFAGITYAICIYCFGIFLYGSIGCICTIKKKHYVRALVYLPLIILSFVALLRGVITSPKKIEGTPSLRHGTHLRRIRLLMSGGLGYGP